MQSLKDEAIVRAIEQAGGNKSEAARLLGIDRKTLYNRLRSKGLDS
jgi:transcriptional regulator of acetoin/glycerol metabolism